MGCFMNLSIIRQRVYSDFRYFLSFGFGSGLSPLMPGTMGTLMAVPFYFFLAKLSFWAYLCVTMMALFLGILCTHEVTLELKQPDYPGIVWDEMVGFWITMAWVSCSWTNVIIGFILFRCFDIFKPYPIKKLESLPHAGLGIMMDDVLAGIFAAVCLYGLAALLG
jgi:phosphatidylglycerophosphatase A